MDYKELGKLKILSLLVLDYKELIESYGKLNVVLGCWTYGTKSYLT